MKRKNPIIEFVFDVWFNSVVQKEVLTGQVVELLQKIGYDEFVELPITQIPLQIRNVDPLLKGQPHYNFLPARGSKPCKITFSPNLLGVALNGEYTSWGEFYFNEIKSVFGAFFALQGITINRMGMRYIDFLPEENIFNNDKVKVEFGGFNFDKLTIRAADLSEDEIKYDAVLDNTFVYSGKSGSVLDVSTRIENLNLSIGKANERYENEFKEFCAKIDKLHATQLSVFRKITPDRVLRQIKGTNELH